MAEFDEKKTTCPHCGQPMAKWVSPAVDSWGGDCLYICFNDECGYYQRGWDFTFKKIGIKASYRPSLRPQHRSDRPLPGEHPGRGP